MSETTIAILNANIITLNPKQPEAQALLIQNERILRVGSNKEIKRSITNKTKVVDAKGATVIPGLVDCHIHMTGFGYFLQSLDLREVKSIKEMQRKLRSYAEENPERKWILEGRWDQERFSEKRYPTRLDLDAAVKDKPIFLRRVCGHVGIANSRALRLAGITRETVVEGGQVDLDEHTGEPNGILRENAMDLASKVIPESSPQELENACVVACQNAVEAGLTGVHWLVDSADEIRTLQKLYFEGKLPIRVYLGISVNLLQELANLGMLSGFGNDMLKIGFVKISADGSLGGHTAALREPYSDKPETKGMMLHSQRKLNKFISEAHEAGLQVAVHAIGDRAIEAVLKAYENALNGQWRENHRHRIEHCSVLNPKLIRKMKRLGLVASVQPHFIVSDFWTANRLGKKRTRWIYPFKTLMKEDLVVASGSDCPVEKINPLLGIWAAVTRQNLPEENLTAEEALKTYTINAAFASFDEDRKGTIEVGKLADLTVLSDNLLTTKPDKIKDTTVEMTIVGGKFAYSRKKTKKVIENRRVP